ncbi:MAG TPA: hypothetical protein VMR70_10620 [Flavisolibacter sp.]|nr:hypothetical protein [Flavisolibacter sp.]
MGRRQFEEGWRRSTSLRKLANPGNGGTRMIVNSPTKADFEKVAKENLTQAFNLLFKVYDNYIDHDDEVIREEVPIDEIWSHHHGTIRTALILLHQAIESLMKGVICETSPLLLIDKPRKDWPSLPTAEDKDFDSLYTIGGEALLTTFCAVHSTIERNSELINFIEGIRQKRNQAIHGTNIKDVEPTYIIENVLTTFTIWFGKDSWHKELKNNLLQNPLFGYFDADYESAISYKFLDFALLLLGKATLSHHLSINLKNRSYFCPECKRGIERDYGTLKSKWAFLRPNEPTATSISCLNCHQVFDVVREKCNINGCKGNVLYDDPEWTGAKICLTCYEQHDYEDES